MPYSQINYNPSLLAPSYFPADVTASPSPYTKDWFSLGYTGRTEIMPHDNVHDRVGGLMGNVPTAAADPVFFLHHCQIDRLWASWQSYTGTTMTFASTSGNANVPTQAEWNAQSWSFVDGKGNLVKQSAPSAMDVKTMGYRYDALVEKPPQVSLATTLVASGAESGGEGGKKVTPQAAPVALAATSRIEVKSGGTTATLAPPAKPKASIAALGAATPGTTLVLSGVKLVNRPSAVLHVFINLPASTQPDITGPYHIGAISLFKLAAQGEEPVKGHGVHGVGGREYSFDVGDVLARQLHAGLWTGGSVTVTISAVGAKEPADQAYLSVGKIELRR